MALSTKSHDEAVQRSQAAEVTAEELRKSLQQERARAAALASELAGTRREIETQAAQSQKAVDAAMKQKQTAEAAIAELRRIPAAGAKEDRRPDAGGRARARR